MTDPSELERLAREGDANTVALVHGLLRRAEAAESRAQSLSAELGEVRKALEQRSRALNLAFSALEVAEATDDPQVNAIARHARQALTRSQSQPDTGIGSSVAETAASRSARPDAPLSDGGEA